MSALFANLYPNNRQIVADPAIEVPVEITNNLIVVQGHIGNSRPLSFLLDTGAAGSVVHAARVHDLGLKSEGAVDAATGDGVVTATLVKDAPVTLSGVRLPIDTLTAIDLSGVEAGLGCRIDGILGFEVFSRYVVDIDYAGRKVRFHEPGGYRYAGKGSALPLRLKDNRPFVVGRISLGRAGAKSAEGQFEFDTGQAGAFILGETFTTKHRLLDSLLGGPRQITTGAIRAGASRAQVGRLFRVQIGPFAFTRSVANFVRGDRGETDTRDYAGQVGGEILRRFRVIVDYSRKRVILEPNRRLSDPQEFDMSGLSLTADGPELNRYRVRALIADSPATDAGVQVGDIVRTIDGKSTDAMTLDEVRRHFRLPDRRYSLGIERGAGGRSITVILRTRRMV